MIKLEQLSIKDDYKVYEMLQRIGSCENEFKNTAHGISYEEYLEWLKIQDDWSRGENLPKDYVPQTIFWLFDDDVPVGFGKIRHRLTNYSREIGGNIGYAIDPYYRGKGYATKLLALLIDKAKELKVNEILLSVEKYNPASKNVIEKNGGKMISENEYRWYFSFD
ncbi:GNAT family N-acetyltransferase [Ruminococcus albus]|uniref:Predicted acetyltransferase n=1 Tax=Ruminococcus albus TaxID=1264 RepID=A0A1I1CUG8_RUMAL|nr:GNAT family N-acetyltransferase [Ruminococcus albus]SFB66281.1 Predicted acetyltransferase [Ruminococcus albus]